MNGYFFTEKFRSILRRGTSAALKRNHEYLGTEHMMLGIIFEGDNVASAVLSHLGVDLSDLSARIEQALPAGGAPTAPRGPDLPYTSRSKRALELAMAEASRLQHSFVGPGHLLIGILAEEQGIAARALANAGVSVESARAELLRVHAATDGVESLPPVEPTSEIVAIAMFVTLMDGTTETRQFTTVAEALTYLKDAAHRHVRES